MRIIILYNNKILINVLLYNQYKKIKNKKMILIMMFDMKIQINKYLYLLIVMIVLDQIQIQLKNHYNNLILLIKNYLKLIMILINKKQILLI